MTISRAVRPVVLLAAACTITGGLAGAAFAPPASAAPSGPRTTVTVFLKAPDAAALEALAAQPITNRRQRLAQLAQLVPSADQHNQVARALKADGFSVGRQSTWSVTASAPASVVTSAFGTRPSLAAHPTTSQRQAATGPLSKLPSSLDGLVSQVYPAGGPAVFHDSVTGTLAGSDFRNAYTPAGLGASQGKNDSKLTVATLQLADFNSADLTHYATAHGLPDPVASKQYKAVSVDGGPSAGPPTPEGAIEVALDQESILSTAPSANQQAYFAPNSNQGFADVFSHVYDDVVQNSMATAPNPHIAALSSSWGLCEAGTGAATINGLYEPVIASLVAAGVNVFSSSGDDGIYDCRSTTGTGVDNNQPDVDFPTSSPLVVSVGGTNLTAPSGTQDSSGNTTASPVNNGSNWVENSWSCSDQTSCQATNVPTVGTGGTGGGLSGAAYGSINPGGPSVADFQGFAKPAYQSANITSGPFASTSKRMVPDIAADADPETGFVLYSSDPTSLSLSGGSGNLQVGGTSLAAPISAAGFTNLLGDSGHEFGVGDLHPELYTAFAQTQALGAGDPKQVFRDVTSGSNGAQADVANSPSGAQDPSVNATAGYDTNTGLGAVLWTGLTPYVNAATSASHGKIGLKAKMRIRTLIHHHHAHKRLYIRWKTTPPLNTAVQTVVKLKRIVRKGHHRKHKTRILAKTLHGKKLLKPRIGAVYVLTVISYDGFGDKTKKHVRVRVKPRR